MQITVSSLFIVALLVWAATAGAQSATYSVSVSFHKGLERLPQPLPPLSDNEVTKILSAASRMLQKPDHKETDDNDVACDVTFTLKGSVRTFDASGSRLRDLMAVVDENNIEALHAVRSTDGADFHVKVVQDILFCRKELNHVNRFNGCAFSPPDFRSIIVVHPELHKGPRNSKGPSHLLWAHEFGHLTGLGHRDDEPVPSALMTRCDVAGQFFRIPDTGVKVNRAECRRLLNGPGSAPPAPLQNGVKCKCDHAATCGL